MKNCGNCLFSDPDSYSVEGKAGSTACKLNGPQVTHNRTDGFRTAFPVLLKTESACGKWLPAVQEVVNEAKKHLDLFDVRANDLAMVCDECDQDIVSSDGAYFCACPENDRYVIKIDSPVPEKWTIVS